MSTKYQLITELKSATENQILNSKQCFKDFLTVAGKNYKYGYSEQLLIYAQKPSATACATFDVWNKRLHRYVKKGSNGIALIDRAENGCGRLKYVYDVSDTESALNFNNDFSLWEVNDENKGLVTETLKAFYSDVNVSSVGEAITSSAKNVTEDMFDTFYNSYLIDANGDVLSESEFKDIVNMSAISIISARCDEPLTDVDFSSAEKIKDVYNLRAVVSCANSVSKTIIKEISNAINNERMNTNERNRISENRGLQLSEVENRERNRGHRNVRENEIEVSQGEQGRDVSRNGFGRGTSLTSRIGEYGSDGTDGTADFTDGGEGTSDSGIEKLETNEVGRDDEQHQTESLRASEGRTDLPLKDITVEDLKTCLKRHGSGFANGRFRINKWFSGNKKAAELKTLAINEFGTGGYYGGKDEINYDVSPKGYRIEINEVERKFSWSEVCAAIKEMVKDGTYLSDEQKAEYDTWLSEQGEILSSTDEQIENAGDVDVTSISVNETSQKQLALGEFIAENQLQSNQELAVPLQQPTSTINNHTDKIYSNLYNTLLSVSEKIAVKEHDYEKWEADGFDALSMEWIDNKTIAVMLTYVQNGDLMHCPEIDCVVNTKEKTLYPVVYQMDSLGIYEEITSRSQAAEVADTLNTILKNVKSEDYQLTKAFYYDDKGEEIEVTVEPSKNEQPKETDETVNSVFNRFDLIKSTNPSDVVLFTFGDFLEAYGSDAELLSDLMGFIPFTRKENGRSEKAVGFPNKEGNLDDVLVTLYEAGYTCLKESFYEDIKETGKNPYTIRARQKYDELHPEKETDEPITESVLKSIVIDLTANTTDYQDAFFVNRENESVSWMYYNPDSTAGGQYVTNTFSFDDVINAQKISKTPQDFFDYLGSVANQTLADVDSEWFSEAENDFKTEPDLKDCTENTMSVLISKAQEITKSVSYENSFDYKITDKEIGVAAPKQKYQNNIAAINLLHTLEFENRAATLTEKDTLAKYVGWGGLSDAFDETKTAWSNEFKELYTTLTPEEYESARQSTLTAFYTPPIVIDSMYKALDQFGFKNAAIIDPACGVGNFIGSVPASMGNCNLYGVEIDSVSGRIAQQLYPNQNISVCGFEDTDFNDNTFDVAIGNVPFGNFKVYDRRYNSENFLIHDYFFAKAIDKVRPNGIIAFITSKGTLDKKDNSFRKYIAQRAKLLGAIRLPNDTFKTLAGTEVTSDIVFLQKQEQLQTQMPDWVNLGETDDGFIINNYFIDNPEMILGTLVKQTSQFGYSDVCLPIEGANIESLLEEAVNKITSQNINIKNEVATDVIDNEEQKANEIVTIPADMNVKNFSFTEKDSELYFRENGLMIRVDTNETAKNRIKALIKIRDSVRGLILTEKDAFAPESEIALQQNKLNSLYDNFVKTYGRISSRGNEIAFRQDESYYLLSSLENVDANGKFQSKADIFTKRTINPVHTIAAVNTAHEALMLSMQYNGRVDIPFITKELNCDTETVIKDLDTEIFKVPGAVDINGNALYVTEDEYLSGNVRAKLIEAQKAAESDPSFAINVSALKTVQPKKLEAGEIGVRLGSPWIDAKYYNQFLQELFKHTSWMIDYVHLEYCEATNTYNITNKNYNSYNSLITTEYGTKRMGAYNILELTLNQKDVTVYDTVTQGDKEKRVVNSKETVLARQKQELIKTAFKNWIWKDVDRRNELVDKYNELYNSDRTREYNGDFVVLENSNPEISLREHQKSAIAHALFGGNTLLGHSVGAGKTWEMAAIAMESKRLGLCHKSMFVVPNHITGDIARDVLTLYPAAKVLVATEKDFETKKRKKFCGRIATGDFDVVVIGHSQFEKLPMSKEYQVTHLQEQRDAIISEMEYARADNKRFTVKQLERTKKGLDDRLKKLLDDNSKDDVVTFEELGVDKLFVDEAHYFKNLFLYTKMQNVAGISTSEAKKSSDLFMKCQYLDEMTNGKGVVFASGTFISNSMTELYTMQRYLQYNSLKNKGLLFFDDWAAQFGETEMSFELAPDGSSFRSVTRFSHFYNLPELMTMFKGCADIKTADMLNLPVPEAEYHSIVVKPSELQKKVIASLAERAEDIHKGCVSPTIDNMLKVTNDGRKLALDQRLFDTSFPAASESKVTVCADNVYKIMQETSEKRLTQLIFCDLSTPNGKSTEDSEFENIYVELKSLLMEKGVPESEIAFIHDAKTDKQKNILFDKFRVGDIRVLIGSTQKLGVGTNIQDKLIASHDLDCPWRPSDLEQRAGRIVRQGNQNKKVDIYRYVTEGTFDAYMYQLVENKQRFISQIMTSKTPVRVANDIDESTLSYAEIKTLATGNPLVKEKLELDNSITKMQLVKASFMSQKYAEEDNAKKIYPAQIERLKKDIESIAADIDIRNKNAFKEENKADNVNMLPMKIGENVYTNQAKASEALFKYSREKALKTNSQVQIGEYRGFKLFAEYNFISKEMNIISKGNYSYVCELGTINSYNVVRIDNSLANMDIDIKSKTATLATVEQNLQYAEDFIKKEFDQEEQLQKMLLRKSELDYLLSDKQKENPIAEYCKTNFPGAGEIDDDIEKEDI